MESGQRPVGVGVIGLNFGLGRCAAIQEVEEARLVAVAARTETTARRAGEQLGVDWHTDYRALLDRDDIEVVAIYTPSALHGQIAIAAARAGKHVLTTKPLEITLDRIDAIVDACASAGVKLATEYVARYGAAHYRAHQAIVSGTLGKPFLGEFSYKCYRPQSYYQGTRGTWATDGGGAMMMQAIHVIDLMLWYFGPPRTVTAGWGAFTHELEAEDTAAALVTFENGALATLVGTTSYHNDRPPGNYGGGTIIRVEVGAERGGFIISDGAFQMWRAEELAAPPTDTLPARNAFQDMARWVRDDAYRSPTLVPGAAARETVAFVLALYESARTGQTVTLESNSRAGTT